MTERAPPLTSAAVAALAVGVADSSRRPGVADAGGLSGPSERRVWRGRALRRLPPGRHGAARWGDITLSTNIDLAR